MQKSYLRNIRFLPHLLMCWPSLAFANSGIPLTGSQFEDLLTKHHNFLVLVGIFLFIIPIFAVVFGRKAPEETRISFIEEEAEVALPLADLELPTLAEAYRVLGCHKEDGDDTLKSHYRRLIKVFHEDKLASKELPNELMTVSKREFYKVRAAFERLRIERPGL